MSKERFEIFGDKLVKDNEQIPNLLNNYLCCVRLNEFSKKIAALESKLAEKDDAITNWETMYKSVVQTCHNDKEEIKKLSNELKNMSCSSSYQEYLVLKEKLEVEQTTNKVLIQREKEIKKQLAESEERCGKQYSKIQGDADYIYKLEEELTQSKMNENFEKEKKDNAFKLIEELKQQLLEKEEEIKVIDEDRQFKAEMWTRFANKCKELKEQLAEKDKEITKLKEVVDTVDKLKQFNLDIKEYALINRNAVDEIYCEHQDKISFAVEQLEKVKETTECVLDNALKNSSLNQSYYDRLLDEIDNQIKKIKGE